MATITSTGVGSGLDINSLVAQLVAAERAPAEQRLTRTDVKLTAELSALSRLKGAMSTFETALGALKTGSTFEAFKTTTGDDGALSATATAAAAAGRYDVEIRQLATAARLGSHLFAGGPDEQVGTGTLTVTAGARSFSIDVTEDGNTLADIRDAINAAADNTGVRAMLIRDTSGTGSYLVLAGTATGADNAITVSAENGDAGLDALVASLNDFDAERDVEARDAVVFLSGYEIRSASNTVSGALDGVTLNLKAAEVGKVVSLSIERDDSGTRAKVDGFIEAYNALAMQVKALGAYDAATRMAGPLIGDSLLRNIDNQLRRLVTDPVAGVAGNYQTLASLGITLDVSGTLTLNSARYEAAVAADRGAVGRLFSSEQGIAQRLDRFLDERLSSTGELASRTSGINDRIKDVGKQREALDARMQLIEQRYMRQFSALDTMLSQLQTTSSYLTQQLQGLQNLNASNRR